CCGLCAGGVVGVQPACFIITHCLGMCSDRTAAAIRSPRGGVTALHCNLHRNGVTKPHKGTKHPGGTGRSYKGERSVCVRGEAYGASERESLGCGAIVVQTGGAVGVEVLASGTSARGRHPGPPR